MAHALLLELLEELDNDDFEKFKWLLCKNSDGKVKKAKLEGANRMKTVDVMTQAYTADGAVEITKSTLKNINQNDLVQKCEGN